MKKNLYILFGKSSSGKDTIFKELLKDSFLKTHLTTLPMYTTRKMRDNELQGVEYNFVTQEEFKEHQLANDIFFSEKYEMTTGPVYYYMKISDIDPKENSIIIGNISLIKYLVGMQHLLDINIVPIYIYTSDFDRLFRMVCRENTNNNPDFKEVCRRYLADESDFDESFTDKFVSYKNDDLHETINNIIHFLTISIIGNEM